MHCIVHANEKETKWRGCNIRVPAVKKNSYVMVPMKENQGLFMYDNKERIDKLTV